MKTVLSTKGICLIHNHNYKDNPEKYTIGFQRREYKGKIHEYKSIICSECKINRRKEHYIKNKEYELKRNKFFPLRTVGLFEVDNSLHTIMTTYKICLTCV